MSPRRLAFAIAAPALLSLLLAACGGGESQDTSTPGSTPAPGATATAQVSGTPPSRYCLFRIEPAEEYNLEVEARWKDNRITIEGSVDLPGPAEISWYVCQNRQLSPHFRFVGQPKLDDGKIRGAVQVVEDERLPATFDPNATFEVVVYAQDAALGIPLFAVGVPVEGKPD